MPKRPAPESNAPVRFIIELPSSVARELDVFCKHHFDASRAAVVRRAISWMIEQETRNDPALKQKVDALRQKISLERIRKKEAAAKPKE